MPLRDPRESVAEIGLRVDAIELRRLYDRVDRRGTLAAGVGTGEEVILAPQCDGADGVLSDVVVSFKAAIGREPAERLAPCQGVPESIGQRGLGRELSQRSGCPVEEAVDQRGCLLALPYALSWHHAARLGLDLIDHRDPIERFFGDWRLGRLPDIEDLPAAMRPAGDLNDRPRPGPCGTI